MKNRRVFALILAACLLGSALSGCGVSGEPEVIYDEEPSAQPQMSFEEQKQVLEREYDCWAFADPYDCPWYYTFTDLDHNGLYEVLAASTQGSGIYTYAHFWELLPDGSGIRNCWTGNTSTEGPDDWPEIIQNSLTCYYDAATDSYFYVCEGVTRDGAAHSYTSWDALRLKNGTAFWERLANRELSYGEDGGERAVCTDPQGNSISQEDYDSACDRRFAGMEKSGLALSWTEVDTRAEEFQPVEATPEPDPEPQQPNPITITKHPTGEALAIGGNTWFIAHADGAERLDWQVLDPEGTVYSLEQAMAAHPGMELEILPEDTIALRSTPLSMNGWAIQARFEGQGYTALSEPAYVYVGDYVTLYGPVIEAYRELYDGGHRGDSGYAFSRGLSEMTAYSEGVGYAMKDLDRDGVPELIVAGMGTREGADRVVYGLYTLSDSRPVNLATSMARMRYYVRTDSSVYYEGSGGAAYSYNCVQRIAGGALEDVEILFTDLDENNNPVYYYQQGHSESYPSERSEGISQTDYQSRLSTMESLIYQPILTRIA